MKQILLAAVAMVAVPALAQTTTTTDTTTTTTQSMPMAQTGTTTAAGDPVGGYQPATAPLSGAAAPGVTPVFQAAPSPDQAYPAPPPLASYPICKKGQFDKCMNGPHSTHSREVRGRRTG